MRLLLNRRLHVNMGNFEHLETTASVEVDTDKDTELLADLGINPTDVATIQEFIQEQVETMIQPDVEDAHWLTDIKESFVHEYAKEHQKEGR